MLRIYLLSLFGFFCQLVYSQVTFNGTKMFCNEWIKDQQKYYKINVASDGLYQIKVSELREKGILTGDLFGENVQIMHLGQQIPAYTSQGGKMSDNDYIMFYGKKNRAEFEYPLFQNSNELLNSEYSMFTDVSAYFLTWNTSSSNTRFSKIDNILTDTVPRDLYYIHSEKIVFTDVVNKRGQGFGNNLKYPKFDVGQGYSTSPFVQKQVELNFKNVYDNGDPAIVTATIGGYGEDGTRHKAEFHLNNELKGFESFIGFKVRTGSFEIPSIEIEDKMMLNVKANGSPDEHIVLSNINFTYTRSFDFDQSSQATITVPAASIRKHLVLNNFKGGATVWLVDLTNNLLLSTDRNNDGTYSFQLPVSIEDRTIFICAEDQIASIQNFTALRSEKIVNEDIDYLILSHEKLINDPSQMVQKYAEYRRSQDGGSHKVKIVDVVNLYDQFSFGIHGHSAALRNYFNFVKTKYPNLKNVFIIGKGVLFQHYRKNKSIEEEYNLVPTYGMPGADPLLVCDESDKQIYAIGRLPITNVQQISDYLTKVKEHEYYINHQAEEHEKMHWSKRIIHLAGGDPSLYETLESHLDQMAAIIESNQYGASVKTFHKEPSAQSKDESLESLMEMINTGVSLVTFMGHSAQFRLDFNLLNSSAYANKGKYHTFMAMGCYAGQIFETQQSISEEYNLIPDKGSIVYLSNSTAGIPYVLSVYGSELYRAMGGSYYGKSIGDAIRATNNIILNETDEFIKTQAMSITYNGDPAIRMNVLKGQDFMPVHASAKTIESSIYSSDKTVAINLDIMNLGVNYNDSLEVQISVKLPNGELKQALSKKILSPKYKENITFNVPLYGAASVGLNRLFIRLDPNNLINEFPNPQAEGNNSLLDKQGEEGIEFFVFGNKTTTVIPANYSIVNENQPTLVAFNANLFSGAINYNFEIDTTIYFNSPLKVTKTITQAGGTVSWPTKMNLSPNTVYYWRVAATQSANSALAWQNSSFIYLPNSAEGFNQSHYYQYKNNEFTNLKLEATNRQFEYENELIEFRVSNGFIELPSYIRPRIYQGENYIMDYRYWEILDNVSGIITTVFNMKNGSLWTNTTGSDFGSYGAGAVAGKPFFLWKTETPEERKKLYDFLTQSIPDGTVVVLQTLRQYANSYYPEEWEKDGNSNLYTLLESYGAKEILKLKQLGSVPYNLVYKKADRTFEVKESVGNLFSENELVHSFYVHKDKGDMNSVIVGPSANWDKFEWNYHNFNANEDIHSVSIIGVKTNGSEDVLYTDITNLNQDLSTVSATEYPYLKLKWKSIDESNRTPAQMDYWRVLYRELTDVAVSPSLGYTHNKAIVNPGEYFTMEMPISNISKTAAKPVLVKFTLLNPKGQKSIQTKRFSALASKEKLVIPFKYRSWFISGKYQLILEVNPNEDQKESDYTNNIAIISFEISAKDGIVYAENPETDKNTFGNKNADVRSQKDHLIQVEISPNPTRKENAILQIQNSFENGENWSLQIINGTGQIILSKKIELEKGNHTIPLELESNMIGGMYFYRFLHQQAEKSTEWQKLQILE